MKPLLVALVGAVLIAGGSACGQGAGEPPDASPEEPTATPGDAAPSPAAGEGPASPAPTVPGVRSAPPPAWIESGGGDSWLAFSSYCWDGTCITARPPEQRTDIPEVRVRPDETVRFHLGFTPTELRLRVGDETYELSPDAAEWQVQGSGGLAHLDTGAESGSASYLARLVVE